MGAHFGVLEYSVCSCSFTSVGQRQTRKHIVSLLELCVQRRTSAQPQSQQLGSLGHSLCCQPPALPQVARRHAAAVLIDPVTAFQTSGVSRKQDEDLLTSSPVTLLPLQHPAFTGQEASTSAQATTAIPPKAPPVRLRLDTSAAEKASGAKAGSSDRSRNGVSSGDAAASSSGTKAGGSNRGINEKAIPLTREAIEELARSQEAFEHCAPAQLTGRIAGAKLWQVLQMLLQRYPQELNSIHTNALVVRASQIFHALPDAGRKEIIQSGLQQQLADLVARQLAAEDEAASSLRVQRYTCREYVNTLYGFARLHFYPGDALFGRLVRGIESTLKDFLPQHVSNTLMAFAKMERSPGEGVLQAIVAHGMQIRGDFNRQALDNTVWALGALGMLDAALGFEAAIKDKQQQRARKVEGQQKTPPGVLRMRRLKSGT